MHSTHSTTCAGAGIDADIVFKVTTERDDGASPFGPVCLSAAAFAYAFFTEAVTGRPIYAVITLCHFDPAAFHRDLETMLHEILHTLVRPDHVPPPHPLRAVLVAGMPDLFHAARPCIRSLANNHHGTCFLWPRTPCAQVARSHPPNGCLGRTTSHGAPRSMLTPPPANAHPRATAFCLSVWIALS